MVTFDLELFSKLLLSLQTLIKTSICFFNENFESTFACTSPMNVLCRLVKHNEKPRCAETDYNALTHCKKVYKNKKWRENFSPFFIDFFYNEWGCFPLLT